MQARTLPPKKPPGRHMRTVLKPSSGGMAGSLPIPNAFAHPERFRSCRRLRSILLAQAIVLKILPAPFKYEHHPEEGARKSPPRVLPCRYPALLLFIQIPLREGFVDFN